MYSICVTRDHNGALKSELHIQDEMVETIIELGMAQQMATSILENSENIVEVEVIKESVVIWRHRK